MASPVPDPASAYSFDKSFSNPVYSADTIRNSKLEVVLNPYNFAPFGGFAKAAGSTPNSSDTKIIYTVRHGNTPHNEDARVFGRPVAWRYLAMLQKNFDPAITPTGVGNARGAADMLVDMMVAEGAPRPVTIYSSPLRRCVETAMQMIKKAGLDQPGHGCGPVTLRIKEGLREWMGYGHGHQSDRKGGRQQIAALVDSLRTELGIGSGVRCELDVPEQEQFHDEVYVDVDRRVRAVLDGIFSDAGSGACVMLVLHNRCNKSLLRVLGHAPADVDAWELANCAMLSYRVTRAWLNDHGVAERAHYEQFQRQEDVQNSEDSKRVRLAAGVEQVRAWSKDPSSRNRLDDLFKLLKAHASHDPAAQTALRMLEVDLGL